MLPCLGDYGLAHSPPSFLLYRNIATETASQNTSSTSKRSLFAPQDEIEKRGTADTAQSISSSSLSNSNIAYLFLQPTSDKSVLCSSCSKNIMAAYISFETSIPYAIGLSNSDILNGQSQLYSTMKSVCGDSFTTSINEVAGTTAFAAVGGANQVATRLGLGLATAGLVVFGLLM